MEPITNLSGALLDVRGLKMRLPSPRGLLGRAATARVLDEVSFFIREGETLGLVGESGCGKTALAHCILRLCAPTDGQILYHCQDGATVDLARLPMREVKRYRQQIRLILPDPALSLDPHRTVRQIIGDPLKAYRLAQDVELDERVVDIVQRVGLRPDDMARYPHTFSRGERQRIALARALVVQPRLVVADDLVSQLDTVARAQVLGLLQEVQQELRLTWLFTTVDLSQAWHFCDRVAVMCAGRLVEVAATEELAVQPLHPYTEMLLAAVPRLDAWPTDRKRRTALAGDAPDLANPPTGCRFHPRCNYVQERCRNAAPRLREVRAGRLCACHCADELTLRGIG